MKIIRNLLKHKKSSATIKGEKNYAFTDRPWPVRYEIVKKYVPEGLSIIDIGAGEEYIVKYIKPKTYFPIDIYPCTPRTTVVDLNKEDLPGLDKQFDMILAQGLFEYLFDGRETMKQLHQYSDKLLTTCYYRDKKMKLWNYLWTKDTFENALKSSGWRIIKFEKVPNLSQYVYYCESLT